MKSFLFRFKNSFKGKSDEEIKEEWEKLHEKAKEEILSRKNWIKNLSASDRKKYNAMRIISASFLLICFVVMFKWPLYGTLGCLGFSVIWFVCFFANKMKQFAVIPFFCVCLTLLSYGLNFGLSKVTKKRFEKVAAEELLQQQMNTINKENENVEPDNFFLKEKEEVTDGK